MRDIKFRGLHAGVWIYGDLQRDSKGTFYIVEHAEEGLAFDVDRKTIGQYTGLKDNEGNGIYEGDIVSLKRIFYTDCSRTEIEGEGYFIGTIKFYDNSWCIIRKHKEGFTVERLINFNLKDEESDPDTEILTVEGNIYENPEILTEWERLICKRRKR